MTDTLSEREQKFVEALAGRAALYRARMEKADPDGALIYNRHDCFKQKAEAVEIALYEALQAAELPAEAPDWL